MPLRVAPSVHQKHQQPAAAKPTQGLIQPAPPTLLPHDLIDVLSVAGLVGHHRCKRVLSLGAVHQS